MNHELDLANFPFLKQFSLHNKVAFVSASSQGIGLAIAKAMAASGAYVYINGRQSASLDQALAQAKEEGIQLHGLCADMGDRDQINEIVEYFSKTHERCDVLVNNLGIRLRQGWDDFAYEQMQMMLNSNLLAPMYLSQQMAERMQAGGRIVTISSVAGAIARQGDAVYPITKLGLVSMTRSLAVHYAKQGICCNAIAPGAFATESNAALAADPVEGGHMSQRIPMGRWGKVDEVTGLAVFLASDLASYLTGQVIAVDGGLSVLF